MSYEVKYIIPEDCTEEESELLCPVCESLPDFWQDHSHYRCGRCESPLEIETNDKDEEVWECPECFQNPDYPNEPEGNYSHWNEEADIVHHAENPEISSGDYPPDPYDDYDEMEDHPW